MEGEENIIGLTIFGECVNILQILKVSPIDLPIIGNRLIHEQTMHTPKITQKNPNLSLS
jgi:hypothetical protein